MASSLPKVEQESLIRGDSRTWTDTYTDPATGDPLDMSGWGEWLSQIRVDLDRGTIVATVAVDASLAGSGVIIRRLTAGQADLLPGQPDPNLKPRLYMDVQAVRTSDGFRQTWKRWKVAVEGDSSDE